MTPKAAEEILAKVHDKQSDLRADLHAGLKNVEQLLAQKKRDVLSQQAMKGVGKSFLAGLGGGAAVGGLGGLLGALEAPRKAPVQPAVLDVPFDEEEEKQGSLYDWGSRQVGGIADYLKKIPTGETAETPAGLWWQMPAAIGAGGLGAAAGYTGVEKLLATQRKKEIEDELEQAKQQYREALLAQYDGSKQSEANELGQELDNLFEKVSQDWPGQLLGMYATAALLSGLGGAHLGYMRGRKSSPHYALQKAKKLRRRRLAQQRSPEVFARPMTLEKLTAIPEEPEEEGITEGSP
jgi:hypothetical protein